MGLGYGRFDGRGISSYLFALPSPTGRGVGGEGSWRSCALLRAMKASATRTEIFWVKACIPKFYECNALTPVPSPRGERGEHTLRGTEGVLAQRHFALRGEDADQSFKK